MSSDRDLELLLPAELVLAPGLEISSGVLELGRLPAQALGPLPKSAGQDPVVHARGLARARLLVRLVARAAHALRRVVGDAVAPLAPGTEVSAHVTALLSSRKSPAPSSVASRTRSGYHASPSGERCDPGGLRTTSPSHRPERPGTVCTVEPASRTHSLFRLVVSSIGHRSALVKFTRPALELELSQKFPPLDIPRPIPYNDHMTATMTEDAHLEADYEDQWYAEDEDYEEDYSDLAYEGTEPAEFDW